MDSFDFTQLLYNQVSNQDSLVRQLDALTGAEYCRVTTIPYASWQRPDECFREEQGIKRKLSKIKSGDGIHLFELVFFPPKKMDEYVKGNFFIHKHPTFEHIYMIITIDDSLFVKRVLLPFIKQRHPRILFPLVGQERFRSLLDSFQKRYGYSDLKVTRASLKSRFLREGMRRESIIPMVSWPNLSLDGAFQHAYDQNGWFQSLRFEMSKFDVHRGQKVCADIKMQRNGVIQSYGDYKNIYEGLVLAVCEGLAYSLKLFEHRSRRETKSLDVKPLIIDFGTAQFADRNENMKFIDSMSCLDKASTSVLHGNPYIHLSVIDYIDGSTFDLWVLNPGELVIVPQLKATVHAINRLVSHVFDNYAEGKVVDFKGVNY